MLKNFWDKVAKYKVVRYFISGVAATLVDYGIYEILVMLIFKSTDTVGIAASIAGIIGVLVAYTLHKNITWRDRDPGQYGVIKFVAWNIAIMVGFRPLLAIALTWLTGLYELGFGVCQWIGLPFTYDFVMSTGVYVLMTAVTAVLNFIFYERVVFGKKAEVSEGETKRGTKAESSARRSVKSAKGAEQDVKSAGKSGKRKSEVARDRSAKH